MEITNKIETQKSRFLEELKSNYRKRIHELDTFSKHFSATSSDFRSQYLNGMLDICQYYIDLQIKFSEGFPTIYDNYLVISQSKIITQIWTQTVRNMDLFYSQFVEYLTNYARLYDKGLIQIMQTGESYYDMFENVPQIQRSKLVEIIKEAKRSNDVKEQKRVNSNNQDKTQKQTISKSQN